MPSPISAGQSEIITVTAGGGITLESRPGVVAIIEANAGVAGSANRAMLFRHTGGRRFYGPFFPAGTIKVSAIGGDVGYIVGSSEDGPGPSGGESPNDAPVEIVFSAQSDGTFSQVLETAMTLAQVRPVKLIIDGIIPSAKSSGEVNVRGNLRNLSIVGNPSKNIDVGLANITSVVSSPVSGSGYAPVFQFASVSGMEVGGFLLIPGIFDALSPAPNNSWRGVSGCYPITAVDTANNRVTVYMLNDAALTTGAVTVFAGYCGNVLNDTVVNIFADVGQINGFGIDGGSYDTETESLIRTDGFVAVCATGGDIAFDIGGLWGGYVSSASFFSGVAAGESLGPAYHFEMPANAMVVAGGMYCNNPSDSAFSPHDGARVRMAGTLVATNCPTAGIFGVSSSDVLLSASRFHNCTTGIEVYAGARVVLGGTAAFTVCGANTNTTIGTIASDGAVIYQA